MGPPKLGLIPPLVTNIDDNKQRKKNISVNETRRIKGGQRCPTLDKRKEHIRRKTEIGVPGVAHGPERQVILTIPLDGPSLAETDMDESDRSPHKERRHTAQVDDVSVRPARARADIHHGERTAQVREEDSRDRHAAFVRPPQNLGRLPVLAHKEQRPGPNVDGGVAGTDAGDKDERVDQMDAAFPAGVLDRDGHGALQGLRLGRDELGGVGRAGEAEKEGRAEVDEENAPEDLPDGQRDGHARVFGLGGGDGDRLDAGVEGGAEDEDGGDAAEAVAVEGAGVAPVAEAEGGILALDTAGCITFHPSC